MYAALLHKELVLAVSEANLVYRREKRLNSEAYRCPSCKKRVILVISQQKMPFFKHITLISGQGEKEEHQQSKNLLCAALVANGFPAKVEIPLADQQLRADILISDLLAFEIQCAPLSNEEFAHRHNLYKSIKIKDIWIVGKRHYLKNKIKSSQKKYFRYSKKWGWYYIEIEPSKLELRLKYFVQVEAMTNYLRYEVKYFSLDEEGINQFLSFEPIPIKENTVCDYRKQFNYLNRQLKEKTVLGQKIAGKLYEKHLTLNDLPTEIFIKYRDPLSKANILKYLNI